MKFFAWMLLLIPCLSASAAQRWNYVHTAPGPFSKTAEDVVVRFGTATLANHSAKAMKFRVLSQDLHEPASLDVRVIGNRLQAVLAGFEMDGEPLFYLGYSISTTYRYKDSECVATMHTFAEVSATGGTMVLWNNCPTEGVLSTSVTKPAWVNSKR